MSDGAEVGGGSAGNIVLDLDGVLYLSGDPIPGAAAALAALAERGFVLVFATNNSTRTAEEVAAHLSSVLGLPAHADQIVTSGMAAAAMAVPEDSPAYVLGEDGLAQTLRSAGIEVTADPHRARSVFVGLHWGLTYAALRDATTAVLGGARFIATNTDATFPTPQGPWPGAGTIAAAVTAACGHHPEVAGKPHEPMRRAVCARLGPGPTWMVGDRPETDIAFGRMAGWTTVLVLTGISGESANLPEGQRPDHVVASVAELPGLLG